MPDPTTPPLLDLHGLTLKEVMALPDSVLGESLRRIEEEAENAEDAVAGFQSSI